MPWSRSPISSSCSWHNDKGILKEQWEKDTCKMNAVQSEGLSHTRKGPTNWCQKSQRLAARQILGHELNQLPCLDTHTSVQLKCFAKHTATSSTDRYCVFPSMCVTFWFLQGHKNPAFNGLLLADWFSLGMWNAMMKHASSTRSLSPH